MHYEKGEPDRENGLLAGQPTKKARGQVIEDERLFLARLSPDPGEFCV